MSIMAVSLIYRPMDESGKSPYARRWLQAIGQSIPTATAKQALSRSRVHPQIAWANARRRGDREHEVVELNSKLAVRVNDPTQENLEIKARPCFPEN
jgi:hypothetical protein